MKDIHAITKLYFVGIGGIGMSALARYFAAIGKTVAGYDRTPSVITSGLVDLGVSIHFEDRVDLIPEAFLRAEDTLIVYTPAIPKTHAELQYFQQQGFEVVKRSGVLGWLSHGMYTLAVAGTHGKTTTTTILAHLLKESGIGVTAFLGGVSEDQGTNLIMEGTDVVVIEADEFDRTFLQLHPNIAAITSMDADHLDIYGDASELEASFREFANLVSGTLYVAEGLPLEGQVFGVTDRASIRAINIRLIRGGYCFDLQTPEGLLRDLKFHMPGTHNLSNATIAFYMALKYGAPVQSLRAALEGFSGIKRRFSYHIQHPNRVYIDDYAHHPTEISALHQAVREMHPNKKVLAVFQPHLFSRTQDFAAGFVEELSRFDALVLLDIYPARELPITGVSSAWLLGMIQELNRNSRLLDKAAVLEAVRQTDAEVILTIGAGDIGLMVSQIKQILLQRIPS